MNFQNIKLFLDVKIEEAGDLSDIVDMLERIRDTLSSSPQPIPQVLNIEEKSEVSTQKDFDSAYNPKISLYTFEAKEDATRQNEFTSTPKLSATLPKMGYQQVSSVSPEILAESPKLSAVSHRDPAAFPTESADYHKISAVTPEVSAVSPEVSSDPFKRSVVSPKALISLKADPQTSTPDPLSLPTTTKSFFEGMEEQMLNTVQGYILL